MQVPQDVFRLPENDDSVKWWEVGGSFSKQPATSGLHSPQVVPCTGFVVALQAVDLSKLDLSHNQITQLPQQLWELSGLVTLLARWVPAFWCQ